jgi:hypothetical protein
MNENWPITTEVNSSKKYIGIPEITDLHYDLWTLKIRLQFIDIIQPVYLTFTNVEGFRVLDEGNLMEFWNNETRANGWLWKVEKGGWHDQEKERDGYFTGKAHLVDYDEYMIVGMNDCLNVITSTEPIIFQV